MPEKIQILPGVNLTYVSTGKFKTGCISLNVITQLSGDTAAENALLPKVLRRGTTRYPDMNAISGALDRLYGASITPIVRKIGECQCFGFYSEFADDDFVPGGEKVLEEVAQLLGDILLSPVTKGGMLLGEYVQSEKKKLIDEIHAQLNNKITYCISRLTALMCQGELYGIDKLGSEKAVEAITPLNLTKHYHSVLQNSRIEIIYCGAAKAQRVQAALERALSALPRGTVETFPVADVKLYPDENKVRVFTEELDVTQGKLTMGFRLGECMNRPNYAAMLVFNAVYGGSVTSKLFMNVREKLSLCYYASSTLDRTKGVMLVYSGVEFSKFKEAYDEILAQLESVRAGDISDWELTSAKRGIINSIMTSLDTLQGVEALCFDRAVTNIPLSPEELVGLVDAVKAEEVSAIAGTVTLDAVHYLTGKGVQADET
ncbi:MAG: insulinase family protein [Oscillospiraceae bacterium]|nr:insulinase family protein [Oscillospiraceae bacterium]